MAAKKAERRHTLPTSKSTTGPRVYRHVNDDGNGSLLLTRIEIGNAYLGVTIRGTHISSIECPTHADVEYLASTLMPGKVRVPENAAAKAFDAALKAKKASITGGASNDTE